MSKPLSKKAFATIGTCYKFKKLYGVTVDEVERGLYTFVWSFKIDEGKAKREGFDKTSVTGNIILDPEFPGCPHCGSQTFVFCGRCGKMHCWDGEKKFICTACGNSGDVEVSESFNIKGGGM